ncbi:MAG: UvrD-helicase domain-containing protein [Vampirovibrionales bacterium]|nr:UvrD-helicase domain-containing protein [Vampirovibrionales bacterium]
MTHSGAVLAQHYGHQASLDALLAGLNPPQQQSVTYGAGPLLVLAGAGSGKTKVLTQRIAYLLQHASPDSNLGGPAAPAQILAVTFTNKAAKEMRLRVDSLVGADATQGLWMGTFHSICGRLLRREMLHYENASGRKWSTSYVIYDTDESVSIIKQCLKALNRDDKLYPPKVQLAQISAIKNEGMDAYAYASSARNFREQQLAELYDAYEAMLSENNALDFDDLLLVCTLLFKQRPDVLERYHRQFRHILTDEFQDTNNLQYDWLRMLVLGELAKPDAEKPAPDFWHGRSLTVVGDVDQSIYSWRGANFRIILGFQQDFPSAEMIKLETNYRSTGSILELANTLIENNTERMPKTLIAHKGQGVPVECMEAEDDRDEAYKLVRWITLTAKATGKTLKDCAVLYRTNVQSRALEEVLLAKGIPYTLIGGVKFYERKEVRDVLSYLVTLYNPYDAQSVKRSLNAPKRGIGKVTLEAIEQYARQQGVSFYEALTLGDRIEGVRGAAKTGIAAYVALIEDLRHKMLLVPLNELMAEIVQSSGYLKSLKEDDPDDNDGRVANLEELMRVASNYKADTLSSLRDGASAIETGSQNNASDTNFYEILGEFLTHMALLSDLDTANTNDPNQEKLVLMTVHAAKGLEFPIVALAGLEEGRFPHFRSLDNAEGIEEERRLMYVAVTRAEQHLLMTYARRRYIMGETQHASPSRFLKELPLHLLEGDFSLDRKGYSREGYEESFGSGNSGGGYSRSRSDDGWAPSRLGAGKKPSESVSRTLKKPVSAGNTSKTFAAGDTVTHPTFGRGKVIQVLGSGSTTLYSIEFEGVKGRKVFDPKFVKLD